MNQLLKDCVYTKGTKEQIDFMAQLGGMNEEETMVFNYLHQGKSDTYIQDAIGVSRSAYDKIVLSVRTKLAIAIFDCINHRMYVR